jgi:hypothetical protein
MSLDHVGPLTRTVQDAAWLFAVLTGVRPTDVGQRGPDTIRLIQLNGYFDRVTVATGRESRTLDLKPAEVVRVTLGVENGVPYRRDEQPELRVAGGLDTRAHGYANGPRTAAQRSLDCCGLHRGADGSQHAPTAVDAALATRTRSCYRRSPSSYPRAAPTRSKSTPPVERILVRAAMLRHAALQYDRHPAISIPFPSMAGRWVAARRQADRTPNC